MTTPFEKAGYTKDTKFRVLKTYNNAFSVGDIVQLKQDDGSTGPYFINNATGETAYMWLPGMQEDDSCALEVYKETSQPDTSPTVTITHNLTIKGHTHVLTTDEMVEVLNVINDSLFIQANVIDIIGEEQ